MATRKPLFIATDGFHEEMADADDLVLGGLNMGGPIDMGSNNITDMAPATTSGEALAWGQAGAELDGLTINPGSDINVSGGGELFGLPNTPTAGDAAASKTYVDSVAQGLDVHESVRATTTGPLALGTAFEAGDAIDNVTLAIGDRILIKDQASGVENGIYIVQASGPPVRAADWPIGYEAAGAFTFVEEGNTNADSGWVCTNDDATDTTNTDALTFSQFSGAGQITAAQGLVKTGNQLDVDLTAAGGLSVTGVTPNGTLGVLADILSTTTSEANAISLSANGVAVSVDDSTIEGSLQGAGGAESLRVKDGGITDQHLDPDINILTTGNIQTTAGVFTGDGSGLTNLPSAASTDAVTISVLKASPGTITKGKPVHLVGYTAPYYTVELADADTVGLMPSIGLSTGTITDSVAGTVVVNGRANQIDTSAWAAGDSLYVSTTAGVLTNVKPTGSGNLIQRIGEVANSSIPSGIIQVTGAGRSNDLPNLLSDNLWLGDGTDVPTATPLGDGLSATVGTEIQVDITPDIGLHFNSGVLEIELDNTPDTLDADADGLKVVGLPNLFLINDVAVSANVTASGLNALTAGGEITLHSHPGSGSIGNDFAVDEAITAGDPVYWNSTADRIGQGASSGIPTSEIFGVAATSQGTVGQTANVVSQGVITGILVGATPGDRYWLQAAGGIATSTPTGSARRLIRVGWAINTTDLWVDIHDYGRRRA